LLIVKASMSRKLVLYYGDIRSYCLNRDLLIGLR